MSWYNQYRPKTVSGLHLTPVRDQLLAFMAAGKLPQVMVFAGPKGTGKTSAARIIGALVNDPANEPVVDGKKPGKLKYQEPDPELDLLKTIYSGQSFLVNELDAASNRGIDEIRALKERVHLPPQMGKMALYILDEAHMLTNDAFNALLKLLEEPPAHAMFILATTERHKIPATVMSRAVELRFRQATEDELVSALESVLKQAGRTHDDQALKLVAQRAGGSFRDGVKILEQVVGALPAKEKITSDIVANVLSQAQGEVDYGALIELVVAKKPDLVATQISALRQAGADASSYYTGLLNYLHHCLMQSLAVEPGDSPLPQAVSHFLLVQLENISARDEALPFLQLELRLLDIIDKALAKNNQSGSSNPQSSSGTNSAQKKSQPKSASAQSQAQEAADKSAKSALELISDQPSVNPLEDLEVSPLPESSLQTSPEAQASSETQIEPALVEPPLDLNDPEVHSDSLAMPDEHQAVVLLEQWQKFIDMVGQRNLTIAALLRSAEPVPEKSNGSATIRVFYSFHRDQLMQPKFLQLLKDCAQSVTGFNHSFEFELAKRPVVAAATLSSTQNWSNPDQAPQPQAEQTDDQNSESSDLASLADKLLL